MTDTKYPPRGGIDPTQPIDPGPDELAAAISDSLNVDAGDIDNISTPTATGTLDLAAVDRRHVSYSMAAPNARQLPNPPPPEYVAWVEATAA